MGLLGWIGSKLGTGGPSKIDVENFNVDQSRYGIANANDIQQRLVNAGRGFVAPQTTYNLDGVQADQTHLAPTSLAAAALGPNQLDARAADATAMQQNALASQLLLQATGGGPSLAGQQLAQAQQGNQAALMSAAASARGSQNSALLQRQLMGNLSDANQQTAAQAAMARIQEQTNAQGMAGNLLQGARGQSLDQAQQNAALQAQNAAIRNQNAQFNAGNQNQFALQQGAFNQQTAQSNAALEMQRQLAMQQQAQQNTQLQYNTAAQAQQNNLASIAQMQQLAQLQLGGNMAYESARQGAFNTGQGLRMAQAQGNTELGKGILGGALQAGAAAAMLSDERAKTDVERKQVSKQMRQFLDAVDAASYRYRPEHEAEGGKGRVYGIMAQSLERSGAGKALVQQGPDGLKRIDTARGFGTLLAALKDVHERTSKLEMAGARA